MDLVVTCHRSINIHQRIIVNGGWFKTMQFYFLIVFFCAYEMLFRSHGILFRAHEKIFCTHEIVFRGH